MPGLFEWLIKRSGLDEPHKGFFERPVPERLSYSYCLGGVAFTCILILFFTGLFLAFYYIPDEKEAFMSIERLHRDIFLGRPLRAVHKWSATFLIITIILHAMRVFITGSYRPPREFNWVAGVFLFSASMAEGFTGYLLPWDQKAYWATVVGTNIIGKIPLIGGFLRSALIGGDEVSGLTLIRFYALHIVWIPLFITGLLWAHFHMIRKTGISRRL